MSGRISTSRAFCSTAIPAGREPLYDWMGEFWARLTLMRRAAETRRELGRLDPRLLADIGVGRATAAREAERWPWDLEPHGTPGREVEGGHGRLRR